MRSVTLVLTIIVALALPFPGSAQVFDGATTTITIGSGETALTSGLSAIVGVASEDGSLYGEIAVLEEGAWLFTTSSHGHFTVGGSLGHFFGEPFIGPFLGAGIDVSENVQLSAFYWPAIFLQIPEEWNDHFSKVGHLGGVSVTVQEFVRLSYDLNKFLDNPVNHLPGASVTIPMSSGIDAKTSVTWNSANREPMYYMGVTVSFPP